MKISFNQIHSPVGEELRIAFWEWTSGFDKKKINECYQLTNCMKWFVLGFL